MRIFGTKCLEFKPVSSYTKGIQMNFGPCARVVVI